MKLKKLCALALTVVLSASVVAGCGSSASADNKDTIIYNLGEDPKTIDPQLNTASGAGNIILNTFEGLMRMDENNKPKEGIAESYTMSEDGLVYTFKLKQTKWSDGKELTANDFKYAWTRALDPKTGAEYASKLYYIKGGEAFNQGKGSAEDLGIKVIDNYTLEVTLENPTAYFLELLAFPTYMPTRQDIIEANGDAWATKPETYIGNGPFKLTQWTNKDAIVIEKNENYHNKDVVKLNKVEYKMVAEATTAYAEFKSGRFDMIDSIPPAEIENALKEGHAEIFTEFATYFLLLNQANNTGSLNPEAVKALNNPKFRKALSVAIDREGIVNNVTKGGQKPATGFVPPGVPGYENKKYLEANGNIEEAKKLMAEAGYPEGKGLPTFTFLINSEGSHAAVAQYLQDAWKQIGVNVEIQQQEFKVFLTTRKEGKYMIGRHGWSGDYSDPTTFLDLFRSYDGLNETKYKNPEYDALLKAAQKETDSAKRMDLLEKAEEMLMNDMPMIPLYYYTKVRAISKDIKGLIISPTGKVDFVKAYKE
ncbi:MAG: peptide ABC transporter substrate-binding protein [Clostridium sp.]